MERCSAPSIDPNVVFAIESLDQFHSLWSKCTALKGVPSDCLAITLRVQIDRDCNSLNTGNYVPGIYRIRHIVRLYPRYPVEKSLAI